MRLSRLIRTGILRLSAVMVALLILVPSLCSARCSSHLCLPLIQQAAADDCHRSSVPAAPAGVKVALPREPCAVAEIVSIVPRSDPHPSANSIDSVFLFEAPARVVRTTQAVAALPTASCESPHNSPPARSVPLRI